MVITQDVTAAHRAWRQTTHTHMLLCQPLDLVEKSGAVTQGRARTHRTLHLSSHRPTCRAIAGGHARALAGYRL